MADPVTIAAGVGMASTAAGSLVSAFGAQAQGAAQAQMYQYQAGVARINEQVAKTNAAWTQAAGEVEAENSGLKTRFEIGSTKATQAASGLDVDAGSAADVRTSELAIGQEDQAIIRSNAAHRAYGYEVEAISQEATATMDEFASRTSVTAGNIGAISSILGGVSSVSSQWLKGSQTGVFGTKST